MKNCPIPVPVSAPLRDSKFVTIPKYPVTNVGSGFREPMVKKSLVNKHIGKVITKLISPDSIKSLQLTDLKS